MASKWLQEQEAKQQQNQTRYPTQGYQGLAGVSNSTAQQTANAQQAYKPGQAVQQAQQQMQQVQAQKPQSYNSKYGAQLDEMMARIQNPEQFKYEFNGDNLFKAYADLYTQKGKQASQDAMGQAAALTGGYGNSYGQMVGQQTYDQYLLSLFDKGMDLRDRAYQAHRDAQGDLINAYGLTADADSRDYDRYRDTVSDWRADLDYATGRYDTEAGRDYDRYVTDRDYWTGLAQVENADYRTEQDRQEAIRQFNESMDWERMSSDQKYAYQYAMTILENGQMPSAELLAAAGLSPEDAAKLMAVIAPAGGSGSRKPPENETTVPRTGGMTFETANKLINTNPMNLALNSDLQSALTRATEKAENRSGLIKPTAADNVGTQLALQAMINQQALTGNKTAVSNLMKKNNKK